MRWLNPSDQATLRAVGFTPRQPMASQVPGKHRTHAKGFSRDIASHRPYSPGDEARSIDWKAYARLDRYYVREYRAEDRATVIILIDCSASMTFHSGENPNKFDVARRAAAGLSWLVINQSDSVGLVSISAQSQKTLHPRSGLAQLNVIDEAIDGLIPGSQTDLPKQIELAASLAPQRAAFILISDLMGETSKILSALKRFTMGQRELSVLRIIDPMEKDFPLTGFVEITGLEGGSVYLNDSEISSNYRQAFEAQDQSYRQTLYRHQVPYVVCKTDTLWTKAALRLLSL